MKTLKNWMLSIPVCEQAIGLQGENLTARLEIETDIGDEWACYLDMEYSDGTPAVLPLSPTDGVLWADMTRAYLSIPGIATVNVRAVRGEEIKKSTVSWLVILDTVDATEELKPLPPNEYEIQEARIQALVEEANEAAKRAQSVIPPGGTTGQVLTKQSDGDRDIGWADPTGGGGGMAYQIGHGLKLESNTLSVNSVSDFEGDNTLPITAAAVEATVGNIEILLGTI